MSWPDLVQLVGSLSWPAVAIFALVIYREAIARVVVSIASRAQKLSLFNVEIHLAEAREFSPEWSVGPDPRQATRTEDLSSFLNVLLDQFHSRDPVDYAVIDIGLGKSWLSSRMYIFSVMLERMRDIQAIVFVETSRGTTRRLVGWARPESIRWACAQRWPWLEDAFAKSYGTLTSRNVESGGGSLPAFQATELVKQFLAGIQSEKTPAEHESDDWVELKSASQASSKWEHTQWLTPHSITRLLGEEIYSSYCTEQIDESRAGRAAAVLRRDGSFVPLVDVERKFLHLLDRKSLLENVASELSEDYAARRNGES